ncbi:DUF1345 domain-containing protein [Altererythrobacter xixiisoli]|uniref:DUF1345 domain-containing protein n=1 Tax=Croceibacterium xixiisoli TaxID=1476466 RepID=A0A6I4TWF0_9SPHN|nr:DUF1345 domain-containing protein [Croceibacterium xixiisoli]
MPGAVTIGNRLAPPRFLLFLALLPVGYGLDRWLFGGAGASAGWISGVVIAFDLAALVFLLTLLPLLRDRTPEALRRHAAENDANRPLMLVLTTLLMLAVMAAIIGELPGARAGDAGAIARLVGTLVLVWLFANSIYTLHYAHAFYTSDDAGHDRKGLDFPGNDLPDYRDFAYFAFTLGMTFQTSDVAITTRPLRDVALLHCFSAFVFNIGVIAFAINALGGAT